MLGELSSRLTTDYGRGYSFPNLAFFRQFFLEYPSLVPGPPILYALRRESDGSPSSVDSGILYAVRRESVTPSKKDGSENTDALRTELAEADTGALVITLNEICHAARDKSWEPGRLNPNLSWTHYRTLLRVERPEARAFYEIEALHNHWSAREMERQINSLLYDRLALSKDKKGLMRLATKGHEIQKPADIFKDPVVMEFLGLPESPKLVETKLEQALIDHLQAFLLELGKGFAFVARQKRLTLDGDHFYADLIFYHTILKSFIIIDLKTGKLTHEDLGQLQLYVNFYDRECRTEGDNPTVGLILCAEKNDAVVRYTLGEGQKKIFASRYKLYLPTEAELRTEMRREVRQLTGAPSPRTSRKKKS
ncbi:MAG: DUF1016 family protein [Verrucomicrobia bacterium]|nr:DUF1016 family protein [Verrucomicrobiota bacterium]